MCGGGDSVDPHAGAKAMTPKYPLDDEKDSPGNALSAAAWIVFVLFILIMSMPE